MHLIGWGFREVPLRNVLLLGAGKIGSAIASLLGHSGDYAVRVGDAQEAALDRLRGHPNVELTRVDVEDPGALRRAMAGVDDVVSACPFAVNPTIARAAREAGPSYFDLTEDVASTRAVREIAGEAADGQVFVPQCGLAPGFVSIAGHHLALRFDRIDEVRLRVGALAQFPTGALKYNLTWSTDGLINEYCNPCEIIRDGRPIEVLPLEGLEQFSLDGVDYEAFNTSGGLGSLWETLAGRVRNLDYKTVRYRGHRDLAHFLIRELRLHERRDLLKDILETAVPATLQDVVLIFCVATGWRDGVFHQISDARKVYHAAAIRGDLECDPDHDRFGPLRRARHPPRRGARPERVRPTGTGPARRLPGQPVRLGLRPAGPSGLIPGAIMNRSEILASLGLGEDQPGVGLGGSWSGGEPFEARSPIDGAPLASVRAATPADVAAPPGPMPKPSAAGGSSPPPGAANWSGASARPSASGRRNSPRSSRWKSARSRSEALGEVQEWIDVCDFAVGLSRQLHGLTIASERPGHRMMEQWHPLGPVGVITAFNFPVAVWAWNAMLALVCGDPVTWKPSEKAPLVALAVHRLCTGVAAEMPEAPAGLLAVVAGGREVGRAIARDERFPLVSATGSVPMGRDVGQEVASRLGRTLLELGGNNALIVAPTADLELALRAVVFSAAGTAGQRCTTLRRLIVHDSLYEPFIRRVAAIFAALPVGDPRREGTLVGPLIDEAAGAAMRARPGPRPGVGRHGPRRRAPRRGRPRGGRLRQAGAGRDRPARPDRRRGDVRADPLRQRLQRLRRGRRPEQRGPSGPVLGRLHERPPRGRAVPRPVRFRLRHRQHQHRHLGRRDRRRLRRREVDRRRPGERQRLLEGLHAPDDQHDQLRDRPPPGPRCEVRRLLAS